MRKKVLVVDDDENITRTCRRVLEKEGIGVDCAGSVEKALEIFENPRHAAILTDIQLPGKSGIELTQIIKKKHPSVKIIAMTGGSLSYEMQAFRAGADAFLKKPFNINDLRRAVKKLLP